MAGPGSAPSRDDGVVRALSEVVGGPLGRHAGHHPWWTPARVALALTAVVLAVGLLAKVPCVDASAHGRDWPHSRVCHTDVAQAYVEGGFAELTRPWTDDAQARARHDSPGLAALPGYAAWGAAHLTHRLTGSPELDARYRMPTDEVAELDAVRREARVFTAVTAVGLAALGLLGAWLLAGAGRRRPWAGAAWAMSPLLLLAWLVGWDLLAAVGVAGALWAHARLRPVLTGVLVGLSAAVQPHAAVLLVAIALLLVPAPAHPPHHRDSPHQMARHVDSRPGLSMRTMPGWTIADVVEAWVAAVLAWALVNVLPWAAGTGDWADAAPSVFGHGPDLGSIWLVAEQLTDREVPTGLLLAISLGVLALWVVAVGALARRARRTPGLAEVALLLMVGVLLVAPAHPPEHALLLLPLAAVAVPRWRDLLLWQCGEVFHLAMTGFYLGGALAPTGGGDASFYWLGVLVRVAAQLWLAGVVVRQLMTTRSNRVAV